MKEVEHINPIIEAARQQLSRQCNRVIKIRTEFSDEDFRELFVIRANQVMLEHKSLKCFEVDDDNREVLNLLYCYAVREKFDKINPLAGIVLTGAYGCGKSVMISAFCHVLNDLQFFGKETVTEIHAIELADMIRLKGVIPFTRIPLLIQDLGKENNVVNAFGTTVNPISNLLAIRAEYGAPTFGSTNMTMEMLEKQYCEFISKRFNEHVNRIFLPGKSRRQDYSINQPV